MHKNWQICNYILKYAFIFYIISTLILKYKYNFLTNFSLLNVTILKYFKNKLII